MKTKHEGMFIALKYGAAAMAAATAYRLYRKQSATRAYQKYIKEEIANQKYFEEVLALQKVRNDSPQPAQASVADRHSKPIAVDHGPARSLGHTDPHVIAAANTPDRLRHLNDRDYELGG